VQEEGSVIHVRSEKLRYHDYLPDLGHATVTPSEKENARGELPLAAG
jgi:hypothetical protein